MRGYRNVGEDCRVCEGPCRYGQCPDCGGHSEHNWGCARLAGTPAGPAKVTAPADPPAEPGPVGFLSANNVTREEVER